jgi:signal transduction histidine kinase
MIDLNQSFMDHNPSPVIGVDLEGDLIYINSAAKGLLESMDRTEAEFNEILPPNFAEINQNCKAAEIGIPVTRMEFPGKVILWTPFFTGDAYQVLYSGVDITRMHRNEVALIHAKEKAEEGERIKAAFLDNMSHEIRTPLNSLLGFMNILADELSTDLSENQQFYFKLIQENGFRLERTMREILDISHFGSGSYEISIEPVDVTSYLEILLQEYDEMIKSKGLRKVMQIPEEKVEIRTDKYCFYQAITHLIDNAVKYTKSGSLYITLTPEKEHLTLKISDTGEGMSEELQRQIFLPFSQGSIGHKKHYQGIGLGLSLVRAYLDAISAHINLESAPGRGSHYTLTIPYHLA